MKYDLKKLRRKLKISVPEIVEAFELNSRQQVYYWERKKCYPEEVKVWMDGKQKEKLEFKKGMSLKAIDARLKAIEKTLGEKNERDV